MALNTSHLPGGEGVLIYNGEMILLYIKKVSLSFKTALESAMKGKKTGELFLTSHRIIFRNSSAGDKLASFCMPFHCLRGVTLEQPVFGANFLKGGCLAQPGGNFEGEAEWNLTFDKGGCIDFGKALLKATDMATRYRPECAPPPYAPPPGGYFAPPPAYYTPGNRDYHGFQPPVNVFPDQPPQAGVFMYEAPPPYAGIAGDQTLPPYPANGPSNGAAQTKEAEAAASHNTATAPPPDPSAPPPSYDDATTGLHHRRT